MAENNATESKAPELRSEAQPVERWDRLTSDQQMGIAKLLRMIDEAIDRPDGQKRGRLPWLLRETKTQLAFIDGHRGTGKTTLMTTLVGAIDDPDSFNQQFKSQDLNDDSKPVQGASDPALELRQEVTKRIDELHNHVVPVQPLDMESLPKGTPLMAAILARVYQAAESYGTQRGSQRRLLEEDPRDHRELQHLRQYQQSVAKALDSNLKSRMGGLDPDQFAEAVMSEEECRLNLVNELEKVLKQLSKQICERLESTSRHRCRNEGRLVFLVPIDDVDLNPRRCLELLRLLRTFSPPRELFFLLMGQYELVEEIFKLQMASDFGKFRKNARDLSTVSTDWLQNQIAMVALANVRKIIPPHARIELPALSLDQVFDFRPLGL